MYGFFDGASSVCRDLVCLLPDRVNVLGSGRMERESERDREMGRV